MTRPTCGHTKKAKRKKRPKPRRYSVSVSAKAFRLFKAGAEARGWSIRQLVEEGTR
jgi:hypothetical protein